MSGRQTGLADLAEALERLREDESLPEQTRHERDRNIGRKLPRDADDSSLLLAWLAARRGRDQQPPSTPVLLLAAATLVALFAGWATATVTFYFDGSGRVNVVVVLAVFVALQLALLAAFALAALPPAVSARLPVLGSLAGASARITPARLVSDVGRLLPGSIRRRMGRFAGDARLHAQVLGEAFRWTLLALSQWMALLFNASAILTALGLVVFTDLAFGWATTLDTSDHGFLALTRTLSTPWAWLAPAAVPDIALVSGSRYFRLQDSIAGGAVAGLGAWWPFLLACMTVYGLLPRVLTLAFSRWRLRVALARAVRDTPDLRDLLARMRTPSVATAATDDEPDFTPPPGGQASAPATVAGPLPAPLALLDWSGVPVEHERLATLVGAQTGTSVSARLAAGGNCSLDEDRASIAALDGFASVAMVCKAWEAPVLDVRDFLQDLRAAQPRLEVLVLPLAIDDGAPVAPRAGDLEQWLHAVRALGDARIRIRGWQGEART